MQINSIKDLQKLVEMCRKTGVETMKVGNIEFTLGIQPAKEIKKTYTETAPQSTAANDPFSLELAAIKNNIQVQEDQEEPVELTEEQLLFYSTSNEPT